MQQYLAGQGSGLALTCASYTPEGYQGFEQGPIRPPSEAQSLLIRVTRNCAWNRCTFCPVYKAHVFSKRPVEDVKKDIDLVYEYLLEIREAHNAQTATNPRGVTKLAKSSGPMNPAAFEAAMQWYLNGARSVFLQDADSLVIGAFELTDIVRHLKSRFPWVERVTSYARSSTIVRIADDDFKAMRAAGLNRIHVGLESGSDKVLRMVRKGASKEMHVKAGLKVKRAGMELSEYVMPGLGGVGLSMEHALETADALSQIDPDFIRLRTLAVSQRAPMHDERVSGRFQKCSDVMIVRETRTLIENLTGVSSVIKSDHILNLFEDLEGKMPQDRGRMLAILNEFLEMEPEKQDIYRVGRRVGLFSGLKDMTDSKKLLRVEHVCEENGITSDNIDAVLDELMQNFI